MDHGQAEPIVSVHLLKTTLAVREEIRLLPSDQAVLLTAALGRFLRSPLKRRQTRRTAWQSLQFVAREFGDHQYQSLKRKETFYSGSVSGRQLSDHAMCKSG